MDEVCVWCGEDVGHEPDCPQIAMDSMQSHIEDLESKLDEYEHRAKLHMDRCRHDMERIVRLEQQLADITGKHDIACFTITDLQKERERLREQLDEYSDVLRGLASYVGCGGYNSYGRIAPKVAGEKIRWGIDHLLSVGQGNEERPNPVGDRVAENFRALGKAFERIDEDAQEAPTVRAKHAHYYKDVSGLAFVDVYRVLHLFGVTDPCIQHAVKKLLVAGGRGAGKDAAHDIDEAIDTLRRWQDMRSEER